MISAGFLAIVPDVDDPSSREMVDAWHRIEPKPYKTRVLDPDGKGMDVYLPGGKGHFSCKGERKRYRDLDNKPLSFRSNHRPRARYLYWRYCTSMLRKSWRTPNTTGTEVLIKEIKRPYWGTRGPFMKKGMLMAFVEKMGHEYKELMEGAIDDGSNEDGKSDPLALVASSRAIRATLKDGGEEEEEEDDTDDEEV